MKTKKFRQDENIYEVIIPFGNEEVPDGGLYDDCPICQRLKRELEAGRVEAVEVEEQQDSE